MSKYIMNSYKLFLEVFEIWQYEKKKRQKLLSSWKQLFLELFVPIDLLGPKKLILSLAQ